VAILVVVAAQVRGAGRGVGDLCHPPGHILRCSLHQGA
jgi:hypothetical protein